MKRTVKLLGTQLFLNEGQSVYVTKATNLPQGGYFAQPANRRWGQDSILVTADDLKFATLQS